MAYIKDVQVGSDIYLIEPTLYIAPTKNGAAYTATLANFSLATGATVQAKFAATNNENATLNVNSTGAKEIHYNGDKITANQFKVNHVYTLVYDGTQWQVVGDIDTNTNTWRGIQDNLTSDSTTESLSAKQGKVLKGLIDAMDATTPAASGNATAFIDSITQTDGKITSITKKTIPAASTSTAGIIKIGTTANDAAAGNHNHDTLYIKNSDELLTTNPFAPASLKGPYISKIDNAFYAADRRWSVTGTNISNINGLFNGDYESQSIITANNTAVISIDFDPNHNNSAYFPGYPYGYILVSFYYTQGPASVSGRVYCNYNAHGIGWHNISFLPISDNTNGAIVYKSEHQGCYNISQLEITIIANSSNNTSVTQIEMHLDRPDSARTPFLSKYNAETLFYNLTAPKFIGALEGVADKSKAANLTTTTNAIAYYTDTIGTFGSKASANGALYSTSTNGSLQWGTLPIAQGGTGATTANNAANALISGLPTWTAAPTADTYFIRRDTGGSAAFGQVKFSSIANITNGTITLGPYSITPVTSVNGHTGPSVSVTAADLGLSKAMRFIGVATVDITDGSTTDPVISGYSTKTAGDVIIDKDSSREYVWSTTSKWELLGGDSSYKTVQTEISSPTASGSTTAFIDTISQNENGVITVTKKNLDTSGTWSGTAVQANYLYPFTDGTNVPGTTDIQILTTLQADDNIPRSMPFGVLLQHGNHSVGFGYFYPKSSQYGGWYIANYGGPSYIGLNNGTWNTYTFLTNQNYTSYAVAKTAGVTAVTWDSTNNKLTRTINGTAADVVTAAQISTALGLGTIASKAENDYMKFGGDDTNLGSGSPAATAKTYWADTTKVSDNMITGYYNHSGTEYSLLFSKHSTYGTILKWTYNDTYIRILRIQGTWKSDDWEKISAGYADSAGTATTATNLANNPSIQTSGTTQITITAGGKTSSAYTIPYATSAGSATTATTTTYIKCTDTRNTALNPTDLTAAQGVRFDFKAKGTIDLTATDNYAGVMSFRPYASNSDWSGGNAHQIAFNSEGLHWRNGSASWGDWYQILDSDNTTAGANNAATLTWNTTYTIAKINGTDIKFTTMVKPSYAFTDLTSHPTTLSGYGITDAKIASGVITLGSNTITPVTSVNGHTGKSVNVTAADLGLSNALHFIGITSTELTDGSTTATLTAKSTNSLSKTTGFVDGDVVMDGDQLREYVWSGDAWRLLGITTSTAYTQPTSTATNTWIAQISQGTDGRITAITGSLDTSGTWSGTATTATNLSAKPSLATSGNNITVTAGGKTSDAFTVPYATSATSAATSKALANYYTSRPENANITHVNNGGIIHFKATSTMTSNKPMGDGSILHFYWDNENAWNSQLYIPDFSGNSMQWRSSSAAGTWDSWRTLLDSNNYTDYAYALDGSNTGTKLQISTQSAAYTNGIQFMYNTTKKGSIGTDNSGIIGIYGTKIVLRPQLDAATKGVEITTDAIYPTASMTLGSTSARWSKLYIGNANNHGDAYTPVYWNDGAPTAVTPIQYCEFTIGSGKKGVKLTHAAFTATSYVTQVVVTSGESNLNSAIAWESAAGYINLTCSATSGAVSGYILVSRGGAITATATDIT